MLYIEPFFEHIRYHHNFNRSFNFLKISMTLSLQDATKHLNKNSLPIFNESNSNFYPPTIKSRIYHFFCPQKKTESIRKICNYIQRKILENPIQ